MEYVLDSTIFLIGIIVTHVPPGHCHCHVVNERKIHSQKEQPGEEPGSNGDPHSVQVTKLTLGLSTGPIFGLTIRSTCLTHMKSRQINSWPEALESGPPYLR